MKLKQGVSVIFSNIFYLSVLFDISNFAMLKLIGLILKADLFLSMFHHLSKG